MEKRHYRELTGVAVADGASSSKNGTSCRSHIFASGKEDIVKTDIGPCVVRVCGESSATLAIVTCHELGLDPESTFGNWIHHPSLVPVLKHSCWYHIVLPGHELGAADVVNTYTMDDLARQVQMVVQHYNLKTVVGVGCGVGGNVLLRYVINGYGAVNGLLLLGTIGSGQSWWTWGKSFISSFGPGTSVLAGYEEDYLVRGFVGWDKMNSDLAEILKGKVRARNPANLRRLQYVYENKNSIIDKAKLKLKGVPILFAVGYEFEQMYHATNMYDVMDPTVSSYMKIPYAACLVHEQVPDKLAKAFKLFVQGTVSSLTVPLQAVE